MELKTPKLLGLPWQIWMPGLMVVLAAAFVLDDDPVFRVAYLVGILGLGWALAIMVVSQRAAGDGPRRISFSDEGIVSPLWSLRWEDVESVSIGRIGRTRVLDVEPRELADIHTTTRFAALNIRLSGRSRRAPIRLPESALDRPLEDVIAEMESAAGRPLQAP